MVSPVSLIVGCFPAVRPFARVLPSAVSILREHSSPTQLGLAGEEGRAYVQCLDAARYTGGGTVTFEVEICEREP